MNTLLRLVDVKKHFPPSGSGFLRRRRETSPVRAVDGISLSVAAGEVLALLGESGSGKTTLARTVLRLTEPSGGQAWFGQENLFAMSPDDLRRRVRPQVRMIFQHPDAALNPAYTVRRIVRQALQLHGNDVDAAEADTNVRSLLDQMSLPAAVADRYPHELSGGQKRRVSICRALATRPRLLFADEPVSGLDVVLQAQILKLLLRLKAVHGFAVVLITHDVRIARQISDRVGIMHAGRLVEVGATDRLMAGGALHPYSRQLLGSELRMGRSEGGRRFSVRRPTSIEASKRPGQGCAYRHRCEVWDAHGQPAVCRRESPSLRAAGESQHVACHLVDLVPDRQGGGSLLQASTPTKG